MTKKVKKKENTKIQKALNDQEMRSDIIAKIHTEHEPRNIFKRINEKLPKMIRKDGYTAIPQDKDSQKLFGDAMMILGLDNHQALICATKENFRSLAIEFANNLFKEYDCKTPSEKSLSQVVVNSYIKLMESSMRFTLSADSGEYITENRTKYLAMLGKEMDRANRQFISALSLLKQIKSPEIRVNVRANTAFIAQNQQLNNLENLKNNQNNQNETNKQ